MYDRLLFIFILRLGMNVLIVDDFGTMRRIVRNLMSRLGYSAFYEAEDGVSALKVLGAVKIDLVLTDWNMPKMSGLELLREMRANPTTADIPVIMITAETKREQIVEAAQAGVNGYIVKPFCEETLAKKIDMVFSRIGASKFSA